MRFAGSVELAILEASVGCPLRNHRSSISVKRTISACQPWIITLAFLAYPGIASFHYEHASPGVSSVVECRADREYLLHIADLDKQGQRIALREVLQGCAAKRDLSKLMLEDGDRFRAALRSLVGDPQVGYQASEALIFLGEPKDLQLIVENVTPLPALRRPPNRWIYDVVCSLTQPSSATEWALLSGAASNNYQDRWADAGAIQTLKLIASPTSEKILEEARSRNPQRARMIANALEYIRSKPAPMRDRNLDVLAQRVAKAVKIGSWEGNQDPVFSRSGGTAFVDFTFRTSEDRYTYTGVFHRQRGVWRLRGVRETLQAFAINSVIHEPTRPGSSTTPVFEPPPTLPPSPLVPPPFPLPIFPN